LHSRYQLTATRTEADWIESEKRDKMRRRTIGQLVVWLGFLALSLINGYEFERRYLQLFDVVVKGANSPYWPGSEALYADAVRACRNELFLFEGFILIAGVVASVWIARMRD
jgi:hypothetical protein